MTPRTWLTAAFVSMVLGAGTSGIATAAEPWYTPDLGSPDSRGCVTVPGGTAEPWDSIIGYDGFDLRAGRPYSVSIDASVDGSRSVRVLVQESSEPYGSVLDQQVTLAADHGFTATFIPERDISDGQVVLQVGGSANEWELCVTRGTVAVVDSGSAPESTPSTGAIFTNQVGYLPHGPKKATVVGLGEKPTPWTLRDAQDTVVLEGYTVPSGFDQSAGTATHIIDFSDATATGDGFVLEVEGHEPSSPFSIRGDLYSTLPEDALSYYYVARSGIAIDGDIAGEDYARPAGHISVAPNQGDLAVPCQSPREWNDGWTCDYTLDVTGGWYDAGDHGKYVVNAGITVHQLLDIAEHINADFSLAIPESGGTLPDILAEIKWELDWMMKMQVPEGKPQAGMVHHKVQDNGWTGLPLLPDQDPLPRQLHRPTTAATLNLAAAAAKGARVFRDYDPEYSQQLLDSATWAWEAAQAHDVVLAPPEDGNDGGGAYDDADVSDEFRWAATELWLTTGDEQYADKTEPATPIPTGMSFDWASTGALATLDLARAGNDAASQAVVKAADQLINDQRANSFGHAYLPADGRYGWGSNSMILNNAIVLATAYDLTGNSIYHSAALETMDYIFGRNVLGQSYVTGYGVTDAKNQHSRWLAAQLDSSLPHPKPGTLAGGPNSQIQDPVAASALAGCAPQACYLDDIESWSTNEMTINWNAPLAWMGAWLVTHADTNPNVDSAPARSPSPAEVGPPGRSWWPWVIAGGALLAAISTLTIVRMRR